MIPQQWRWRHRADGELVGYLAPEPGSGRVVPMSLAGTALGPAQDPDAAARLLDERGLAAVNRAWWCRLPGELTGPVDVAAPAADWRWRQVVLVEVSPGGGRIRLAMAEPAELRVLVGVPVPVTGVLWERIPEDDDAAADGGPVAV